MAVTRSSLAAYLSGTYGTLLADAGIEASDGTGGLKEPIDDTLLAVGVAWADIGDGTVPDADARAALALARYFTLDRIYTAIVNRVDITVDGPQMSKRRSQMVQQVEKSLSEARKIAEGHGLNVAASWHAGTIGFGFVEPSPEWS